MEETKIKKYSEIKLEEFNDETLTEKSQLLAREITINDFVRKGVQDREFLIVNITDEGRTKYIAVSGVLMEQLLKV